MTVQPRLLSVAELSHHLAESYLTCSLYIQEMLQFKRQNHGKFCAMMCCGCILLAVVGHYVPGIMISYIIAEIQLTSLTPLIWVILLLVTFISYLMVLSARKFVSIRTTYVQITLILSVLLWPLVVYHELIQKMYTGLEPILMKLDYSMKGDTQHRKHDKRKVKKESEEGDEPRAETESESEEELSCFAPTVDVKTTALAMAITDSELSDEEASILESGGFSVSRATTPQLTDVSEDLDRQSMNSEPEETFSRDLPEFPSVEEFPSMEHGLFHFPLGASAPSEGTGAEHSESDSQSPASLLIQHLASPLHFVNTHFNGHGRLAGASQATVSQSGKKGEEEGGDEGEVTPEAPGPSRSLEALSEEIVSTAISTVVQNTLSALLRTTEAMEAPCMEEFMPTETPPCPMESTLESPVSITTTTTAVTSALHPHTAPLGVDEEEEEEDVTGEASMEDQPDVTLMATEEEDFELLDQSELEMMDEGLGFGLGGQGVGMTASTTPDTSVSGDQHRQMS